jgi:hypothetical protein
MSDPFAFSHRLVEWKKGADGCILATCQTPTGPISATGYQSRGVMDHLEHEFKIAVCEASAHQKMTWAARQAEVAP